MWSGLARLNNLMVPAEGFVGRPVSPHHGRFGFLTLVFSGLAYVTDPNALP